MLYRHCLNPCTSNSSMNAKSLCLHFKPAQFWYSSRTDDKHQFCTFLKHPTRQPVLCCDQAKKKYTNAIRPQPILNRKLQKGFGVYLSLLTVDENWMVSNICKQTKEKKLKEKILRHERVGSLY